MDGRKYKGEDGGLSNGQRPRLEEPAMGWDDTDSHISRIFHAELASYSFPVVLEQVGQISPPKQQLQIL